MKYVNIPYYYVREYTLCTPRSSGCDSQQSIPIPHPPKPARPTRLSCYRADSLTLFSFTITLKSTRRFPASTTGG